MPSSTPPPTRRPPPGPGRRAPAWARGANLAVRFLVELCLYAALGYWGASLSVPLGPRVALAAGAPLAAMALWWSFLSPKARHPLTGRSGLAVELALFTWASVGLAVGGLAALGVLFEVVAVANALLVRALAPRGGPEPSGKAAS